jgi:hypothetical protein
MIIDVGEKSDIIIDEVKSHGSITLTGKTDTFNGLHEVRVHKNYWKMQGHFDNMDALRPPQV